MPDDRNVFVVKKEDVKFGPYHDFPRDKAEIALIVTSRDKTLMEAGIFKFNMAFDYVLEADEVIMVISGCLVISCHGKKFEAGPGDYMFLKKDTAVNWGCRGETAYFYATYPVGG